MTSEKLASEIGKKLKRQKLTLAIAESCTGGLISHCVTAVSGSSNYFLGSVVAYQNEIKSRLLKVPSAVLKKEGAVSEATALKMAKGVRQLFKAKIGLAITGIAGPTGGTQKKPVGLVYVALSDGRKVDCKKKIFNGSRGQIKQQASQWALRLMLDFIG